MDTVELIQECRSGVGQIIVERERKRIGSGSAFLVNGGLVTNSHNIRLFNCDAIVIRFENGDEIRLLYEDCMNAVATESLENDKDFAYLKLAEPEFDERYVFELSDSSGLSVGEQVLFMGYPFGYPHLTAHMGYISSLHKINDVESIQIDGSVNGGNSGGPLIDLKTGKVAGIVTRAETGILRDQFDQLLQALRNNQQILQQQQQGGARISLGGIDPIDAIRASQAAMEQIASQLRRSANVGIGFAFSAKYVKDGISQLQDENE